MVKKLIAFILILALALTLVACGSKVLHCDHCGDEVKVKENSNMEEDWIVYCAQCNEELFGDDPILGG